MAGHSKWTQNKHKKAATDAKRGKQFTKLARAITVAAREGGGDPAGNATLATAIQKARDYSMPKDNIQRAVERGTGEGAAGDAIERVVYEGYGPGGAAILIEALTDNRNRTSSSPCDWPRSTVTWMASCVGRRRCTCCRRTASCATRSPRSGGRRCSRTRAAATCC
jgi:hypothetical protein